MRALTFNGAVAGLVMVCNTVPMLEPAVGQASPRLEIGTAGGVTIRGASGSQTVTDFGIPVGVGPEFSPMMYATLFTTPSIMVEPQIAFSRTSAGTGSYTSLTLAGQVGYCTKSSEGGSPYVAIGGAFQWSRFAYDFGPGFAGSSSTSGPAIGGEAGYRFVVKSALGVRVNARYRRWFSDYSGLNEFNLAVALGAVL